MRDWELSSQRDLDELRKTFLRQWDLAISYFEPRDVIDQWAREVNATLQHDALHDATPQGRGRALTRRV